jgi:putative endonuclease
MFFVYCLSSTVSNYIYVGLTNNIVRRVKQHQHGQNRTTKPYRPFKLFYVEEFSARNAARQREKYLKSGVGKEFLKQLLLNS